MRNLICFTSLMLFSLAVKQDPDSRLPDVSDSSDTPFFLPPNQDLLLWISAPGYGDWPGEGSPGALLNYVEGSEHTLKVELSPTTP